MANNTANRGAVWTDTEVQALISVWSDSTVQNELDGAVRNKLVFQKVAQRLREKNVNRDWKQCRDKVKNLKTKYREVKDHNAETGRGRKSYKFYEQLDCILGHRPASAPVALLESQSQTPHQEALPSVTAAEETEDAADGSQVQALPTSLESAAVANATAVTASAAAVATDSTKGEKDPKNKKERKTKIEKAMESTMALFIKHQEEAAKDYEKREKERLQEELEAERMLRFEDRAHQMEMMQMLGQMLTQQPYGYN